MSANYALSRQHLHLRHLKRSTLALQGAAQKLRLMKPSTKHFQILTDVSAIIPAGRMTLLLGPPGSGKSTLLQALAGKQQRNKPKVCCCG